MSLSAAPKWGSAKTAPCPATTLPGRDLVGWVPLNLVYLNGRPSIGAGGAVECLDVDRRRFRRRKRQGCDGGRSALGETPRGPRRRRRSHAQQQSPASNRFYPAQQRRPTPCARAPNCPWAYPLAHHRRSQPQRAEERQRPPDRRRRIQSLCQHLPRADRAERLALRAAIAPHHELPHHWRLTWCRRTLQLPLAPAVPVQHDLAAQRLARRLALRTARRPYPRHCRLRCSPFLDTHVASYDSSAALWPQQHPTTEHDLERVPSRSRSPSLAHSRSCRHLAAAPPRPLRYLNPGNSQLTGCLRAAVAS